MSHEQMIAACSDAAECQAIYRAKCHWAIFLGPILVVVIGGLALRSQGYHAVALICFGLLWGWFARRSLRGSEIRLTPDTLFVTAGFPLLKSSAIPLDTIVTIDFFQPSLGSMLDFGKLVVIYGERGRYVIRFVARPGEVVARVRQQILTRRTDSAAK